MAKKYSTAAQTKIGKLMHEFKEGELKSSSGDKVIKRDQAVAIAISEAKEAHLKVPSQRSVGSKKKKVKL